jgi:starch synthase (maltosyl-transferring)
MSLIGRIPVLDVSPQVQGGRWSARAVVGEAMPVTATVFREGHDLVGASVRATSPGGRTTLAPMRALPPGEGASGTDGWQGSLTPTEPGRWTYAVQGWADRLATWHHTVEVKVAAGHDVTNELEEGARLLERAAAQPGPTPAEQKALAAAALALRDTGSPVPARLAPATAAGIDDVLARHPLRDLVTTSAELTLDVDRERALYGSWYEFFPRSEGAGADPGTGVVRTGTFATAAERLPAVAEMGFDVVYLPPIHPIGTTERKGPNNTLTPGPDDPGSPWAIGGTEGGHDAVHPDLGTLTDFDAFVARAVGLGMEVALDFALQCSPDHPWVTEHPEFFTVRPDGTIAYAENPPKKYQDIYPLDFDSGGEPLRREILRVITHWIDHGVRIFRVDNPHTKPLEFWEWLIATVRQRDPDVLFLAEAFTRPPMMHALAMTGFTQSYTYFTWRTARQEIEEYLTDLTTSPTADYMRPNFFVNTPDILHASLQYGGPPVFKIRAVLAATSVPTWGVYAGYELYEHVAVRPGSEEYLDSEKYQLRPRDWAGAEREGRSLAPYLTRLNDVRRAHPALQRLRGLTLHAADSEEVLAYSRRLAGDTVLVVINLDPHAVRETTIAIDLAALGLSPGETFLVHDQLGDGATYEWGESAYARLDPFVEPAHVFVVTRLDGSAP